MAILPGGKRALVTVENRKETVVVQLSDGAVVHTVPGISSNRWVMVR